ncbi:isoaspartyl peptidase/L-asparaginase [bacterium]|nr:isoaspartyl peptidase/L-asparaginase [bacterium]
MADKGRIAVIVHGGAGRIPDREAEEYNTATRNAAAIARQILADGGDALKAAIAAVKSMEEAPILNAGYGSVLNEIGEISFDASVMEGRELRAGAIGAVPGLIRNPVEVARLVMENHPSVLLTGDAALRFARVSGVPLVHLESLVTERQLTRWQRWKENSAWEPGAQPNGYSSAFAPAPGEPEAEGTDEDTDNYDTLVGKPNGTNNDLDEDVAGDTVGAVVRDGSGWIVSALSTGGVRGKPKGRIGDSPLIGCGLYADDRLGGSAATGIGEDIIRAMLGGRAVLNLEHNSNAQAAAEKACRYMFERFNGVAGVIMLDAFGNIGYAHSTLRMAAAYWYEGMDEPVSDMDGNLIT